MDLEVRVISLLNYSKHASETVVHYSIDMDVRNRHEF